MKITLTAARVTLAAIAFADAIAFAQAAGIQSSLDDDNHYILECGGRCQAGLLGPTIGPEYTGAWFDPKQSGHGLFIEVLPDNKIHAAWFTFNPAGTQQAWFSGVGTYASNMATINVVQPAGGRWIPNFDSRQVTDNAWGTLLLTFSDSDHGRVDFNSTLGFATGSMNLTRLTNPAAANRVWASTGRLNAARWGHTMTLLPNGKVLVVGGYRYDADAEEQITLFGGAELYEPATGKWSVAGTLNKPRSGHTATLLPDGMILIVGGGAATAELFDPSNGTSRLTGNAISNRNGGTATLLQNGKILVAGGFGDAHTLGSAELYDPATDEWSTTGSLNDARYGHTQTMLNDGTVLVAGGTDDGYELFDAAVLSTELYDPVTGTWSRSGSLAVGSFNHTATLLSDGRVLVAGGYPLGLWTTREFATSRSELFDPATRRWSATSSLNGSRDGHSATMLPNGDVLVAAGYRGFVRADGRITPPVDLNTAEIYNSSTASWTLVGDLNVARSGQTATLLPNGKVLVAGGDAAGDSAELYTPPSASSVGSGFTGAWYDPAQSGHGLFVEDLSDNHFLAAWFTFNPAGTEQAWFVGVGTYEGNTATVAQVFQPTGGRWIPNFDSSRVVNNVWGTLTFNFTDCNHGKVEFASTLGYGSGSMNLTRLTQPAGFTCP